MATNPTNNAIPSEAPRDLKFNAGKIDEIVNSSGDSFSDRFGRARMTWAGIEKITLQSLLSYGYVPVRSFEDGAVITTPNQILLFEQDGNYYRWDGDLPKVVPENSTPDSSGGVGPGEWVSVADAALRSELSSSSGASLIGLGQTTVESAIGINVRTYGAKGDGVNDDTAAFQLAIDAAHAAGGRVLKVPAGSYLITAPLNVYSGTYIEGDGRSTRIINGHTGSLFTNTSFVDGLKFRFFAVPQAGASQASGKYLFDFPGGIVNLLLEDLLVGNVDVSGIKIFGVFNGGASSTNGSLIFKEVVVNQFYGRGYNFGKGDSVWFYGGRIIGSHDISGDWKTNTAEAIVLNGGMGGFWIYGTDVVLCKYGMQVTQQNGTSNREIFLNSPCFDSSSYIGFLASDSGSYISISNLWTASAEVACIETSPDFGGQLIVQGGTVFNAGGYGLNKDTANPPCGAVLNGGQKVQFSGVLFRNNGNGVANGRGIWCPSANGVQSLIFDACQEYANVAKSTIGASGVVTVNNCDWEKEPDFLSIGTAEHNVRGNRGYPSAIPTPAIPSSGSTVTYNSSASPAIVYLSGGSVTSVTLNGSQIMTSSNFSFKVKPGDVIGISFTGSPAWSFFPDK